MLLGTRLTIALLCGILAVGNAGAAVSLWCGGDSESEASDSGSDSDSENEADSLELALPGRQDLLAQLSSLAVSQPGSQVAERRPLFTAVSFVPPRSLSVGGGTGGPLRC